MKILYLSCHSIHEYDELRILHDLGHEILSIGTLQPGNGFGARPGIPGLVHSEEFLEKIEKFYEHLREKNVPLNDPMEIFSNLSSELVKDFDIVMVMCLFRPWVERNWDVIKDKIVIWRTNGQSNSHLENYVDVFRQNKSNIKIARYSPTERRYKNYAGEDAMLRFAKKIDEFDNWNGNTNRVISLCQSAKDRSYSCNFPIIQHMSENLPYTLYGRVNDGIPYWNGKELSYEELKQVLRDNKVYFYNGTKPSCYTLNFMEAWLTGIPVVAVGNDLGNDHGYELNNYEVPELIENGVNGFYSDDKNELVEYCNTLLNDDKLAKSISSAGRNKAIELFGYDDILLKWKEFFNSL